MSLIDVNWKPDTKQLRGFGWIALVAFSLLGAFVRWKHVFFVHMQPQTAATAANILWSLAGLCGLQAIVLPKTLIVLYVPLTAISLPIGYVLSHVIMAIIYFLIFTPVGLVMRLFGRDPMCRRFEPGATTYWVKREVIADAKRYFRQF